MKSISSLAIIVISLIVVLIPKDTVGQEDGGLYFGLSLVPKLNWHSGTIQKKDEVVLKPNYDVSSMTSIEGNFCIRRIGANIGISSQIDDNLIGKAYRYGGLIGINGYVLKMQTSKITGAAKWGGKYPTSDMKFEDKFTAIDLIKTFELAGLFVGVGYQTYGTPIQLSTYIHDDGHSYSVRDGEPAYDLNSRCKSYNVNFGLDLLRSMSIDGCRLVDKIGVYCASTDKLGFGYMTISDEAVAMAEALNPGCSFVDKQKPFTVFIDYFITLGVRYAQNFGSVGLVLATGYDFEGIMYVPFGRSYHDVKNNEMTANIAGFHLNHGISVKMYISFNRNWGE